MSTSSAIRVHPVGAHPTVAHAAQELARCLSSISGRETVIDTTAREAGGIRLGTAADITDSGCPAVSDAYDDAVAVNISTEPSGTIVGANPRSVLLAVYRYLNHLGCRWVRPGPDGELLPSNVRDLSCCVSEKPAYRHRGMCIEGAVSEEHVRNMIEWLPRVGMNAYFTQFRESFTFFDRWYTHSSGSHDRCEPFTREEARTILRRLVAEIRKRSLLYHAVGHGWTCDPFGMPGLGWEFEPVKATPEIEPYLALVNGKREVWGGVPLNTNLCYSNPTVRRIMVEDMLSYVTEHPEIDLLHVWLADGANNQCECEACSAARPSDFYVMLLNELDAALTAAHLPVRVVFLIYVDLLWPPERERIANPDRFVLMFAPITRSYSRSLQPVARDVVEALPPYTRNHLQFPKSVEENVAFLRAWETAFRGDSFDFDYHMMWDHYNDPGHCRAAAVLHEDVRQLAAIGLNGLVSCQTQRAAFPTGLMLCAMAQALWDPAVRFSTVEEDHFRSAFGPDWQKARSYLSELSELFDPEYVRGDRPSATQASANVRCDRQPGFGSIPDVIADFRPVIQQNMNLDQPVWAASWRYLNHHADICVPLARAYAAREMGDGEEAQRMWKAAEALAWEREPEIGNVLDVYLFTHTLSSRFRP